MPVPILFWCAVSFGFGISIGSFLNVVVWRLPLGKSVSEPQWSFCPRCETRLRALDLIPLLSFLALGRRCRYCHQPISWRYFNIELLTGAVFVALFLRFQTDSANAVAAMLFAAALIPIYFIDLATFTIPDSLNLFALLVAVGRDIYGAALHEAGHELLGGWLPRSIAGAIVGVLLFGAVRVVGWLWKRQEAMGLGDVLLARAMGAMLVSFTPPGAALIRLFPIWVLLACLSGIVVGPLMIAMRRRREPAESSVTAELPESEMPDEDNSTLQAELGAIGYCLLLGDALEYLRDIIHRPAPTAPEQEVWEAAPTAIPFGPFLVIGFLATLFGGDWLTTLYLTWALPKPIAGG